MKDIHTPILIYQMGKVGSSALKRSIPGALHIHNIVRKKPEDYISPVRAKFEYRGIKKWKRWLKLWRLHLKIRSSKQVKIITLVREPVGRDISMFFQALPFWLAEAYIVDGLSKQEGAEVLRSAFYRRVNHAYALNWFDVELKVLTGIDVFSTEFDPEKGFMHYKNKQFQVLLVRHDKLECPAVLRQLSDFVGSSVTLGSANSSAIKWYAPIRSIFLDSLALDEQYLERMLSSKLTRHFFTKDEIEDLKVKYRES